MIVAAGECVRCGAGPHDNCEHRDGIPLPKPLDFGDALRALKDGKRVARAGWNGKGLWLALVSPMRRGQERGYMLCGDPRFVTAVRTLPWIGMKTVDDGFVPWLASQTDMLAEDWEIVS